jgi:hypothetical protein
MNIDVNIILLQKARGIADSIDRMRETSGDHYPTEAFANDYNHLKHAVATQNPDIASYLPPSVRIVNLTDRSPMPANKFYEIHGFCNQIIEILKVVLNK